MPNIAEAIGVEEAGTYRIAEAVLKPFLEPWCGRDLIALGALAQLLPPPPARVLNLDCGCGWSSCVLSWMGYTVVGLDVDPDLIAQAQANGWRGRAESATFRVEDCEGLDFRDEFDGAVFYGSLRYAADERASLAGVLQALRPGGVCVCREPVPRGGDRDMVRTTRRLCGLPERHLPPEEICAIGRAAGFRSAVAFALPEALIDVHWGLGQLSRTAVRTAWGRWYDRLTWAPARRRRRRWREVLELSAGYGQVVVLTK